MGMVIGANGELLEEIRCRVCHGAGKHLNSADKEKQLPESAVFCLSCNGWGSYFRRATKREARGG